MSTQTNSPKFLEQDITAALYRSAQLAREEAIRYGTGIVVNIDGKIVEISTEELKKQAQQNKNEA
ncbi:MAG: hypothetical protein KIG95_13045 [Comamonas sp.]|nr:hypothetical protein [Comamonas sp.]